MVVVRYLSVNLVINYFKFLKKFDSISDWMPSASNALKDIISIVCQIEIAVDIEYILRRVKMDFTKFKPKYLLVQLILKIKDLIAKYKESGTKKKI